MKPPHKSHVCAAASQAAKKVVRFVILSEAKNLSFFSWAQIEGRFLASPGIALIFFPAASSVAASSGP
jgi:hypothetical protein